MSTSEGLRLQLHEIHTSTAPIDMLSLKYILLKNCTCYKGHWINSSFRECIKCYTVLSCICLIALSLYCICVLSHYTTHLQVGTSSVVYPAAMFAPMLAQQGVPVAEFNIEETPVTNQLG